jgi:hypothetical protein
MPSRKRLIFSSRRKTEGSYRVEGRLGFASLSRPPDEMDNKHRASRVTRIGVLLIRVAQRQIVFARRCLSGPILLPSAPAIRAGPRRFSSASTRSLSRSRLAIASAPMPPIMPKTGATAEQRPLVLEQRGDVSEGREGRLDADRPDQPSDISRSGPRALGSAVVQCQRLAEPAPQRGDQPLYEKWPISVSDSNIQSCGPSSPNPLRGKWSGSTRDHSVAFTERHVRLCWSILAYWTFAGHCLWMLRVSS